MHSAAFLVLPKVYPKRVDSAPNLTELELISRKQRFEVPCLAETIGFGNPGTLAKLLLNLAESYCFGQCRNCSSVDHLNLQLIRQILTWLISCPT
jgi:hypothetical protein